jgi:outer membrane immunogenic protein
MKFITGLIGLTLTGVAALSSANAGDMYYHGGGYGPSYAEVNWSGFYAGVNGGGAWSGGNQLVDEVSNVPFGGFPFGGVSPSGGFGGGQIGYNWQSFWRSHLVFGIEADIQGSGIGDHQIDANGFTYKSNLDYFGTVRGRLGYALDNTLVYFTSGFAYGGLRKYSDDFGPQSYNGTATGYVLGGGLEYKFSPAWSIKAEYQYLNFGKNDPCGGGYCFGQSVVFYGGAWQHDDDYHTVRAGLNYHFVSGYEPLK